MTGYTFALTCPTCGDEVRHQADGVNTPTRTCALAACTTCGAQFRLDVLATLISPGRINTRPAPTVDGMQPTTDYGRRLVEAFR